MNNRIHRAATLGSLSVFSLLSLVLVGCPPATVEPVSDAGSVDRVDGGGGSETDDDSGVPVVEDELTAAMAPIEDGYITNTFLLDARPTQNPGGRVLEYLWEIEVVGGEADCGDGIDLPTGPLAVFTPACRGVHHVTLTVSLLDDAESQSKALESFSVDNRLPVLSGLATEETFLPGADVTISAEVDDADGDPTTCTAGLAADNAGDPTGLVISGESTDCTFTITTPVRVDTWKVQVVAHDDFGDSMPMTIELRAGNDPPVIGEVAADAAEVAYSCVDDVCTAATVRVTVEATDDTDDFEDLVITLDPADGSTPPDGVDVAVTPVAGTHGAFDIVVSRPDLGPIKGTYTFTASVTEVTAETPSTVTQDIGFDVGNQDPVIEEVKAPAEVHAYAAGSYSATLSVMALTSDPEANALTTVVELLSCPQAAAGEAACGGAGLTITETAADRALDVELSTADLANLAGEYTFRITTTDADGDFVFEDVVAMVKNAAPALATNFVSPVQQSYTGSAHTALTPLFYDFDGDPITATLSVTCPDASTTTLPGQCDSGQSLTIDAGVLQVTGPATGLLGDYVITGTLTDGAATGSLNATFVVANTPPTLLRTSEASQTCHHTTSGTTVTNESGCGYTFVGMAADINDDPIELVAVVTGDSDYSLEGAWPSSVPESGALNFSLGLETSYSHFVSSFTHQEQVFFFVATDPFGLQDVAEIIPLLDNRTPTSTSTIIRNVTNTGNPPQLHCDQLEDDGSVARYFDDWSDGASGFGSPYEFSIVVDATDPDGDPMRVELKISSSDRVEHMTGNVATTRIDYPPNGVIPLRIPGRPDNCSGIGLQPRYREWTLGIGCIEYPCSLGPVLPIVLNGKTSRIFDAFTSSVLGIDISRDIQLADRDPYTCY